MINFIKKHLQFTRYPSKSMAKDGGEGLGCDTSIFQKSKLTWLKIANKAELLILF